MIFLDDVDIAESHLSCSLRLKSHFHSLFKVIEFQQRMILRSRSYFSLYVFCMIRFKDQVIVFQKGMVISLE